TKKKTPPDMASGRRNWYGEERSLVAERPNFLAGFIFAGGRQRFGRGRGRDAAQLHQLRPWGFPKDVLAIQLRHALVFLLLPQLLVASAFFFFARRLGDAQLVEIVLYVLLHQFFFQNQRMLNRLQSHLLATRENFMTSVFLVPLGQRRRHVHLFDDVPPADARVVRAERDLALLRRVGNDALLRAAEIVVKQILEPHPSDEQEVPAVLAAPLNIVHGPVAGDLAVVLAADAEALVELRHHVRQLEVLRSLKRIVVAEHRERNANSRKDLAPRRVVDPRDVFRQLLGIQKRRDWREILGLFVDHHSHADPAVWMAAAAQLSPFGGRPMHQIREIREGAHERDREPVPNRLAHAYLILHGMRQMRERKALRHAALVRDCLVAASEGNGLEGQERNFLRIIQRELDDLAHLLVVNAVDDRRDRDNLDARLVQIVDGLQLHVE